MFKTIVLAHDGSEGAQRAVPFAVELARRDDARIVIAHIEEDVVGKGGGGPIHATEDEILADIRRQAEELSSQDVDTTVEMASVMVGGPAHPIMSIADKAEADLIVCGTRGHSPVSGLLLGSVAQRLIHLAHQPILVVPKGASLTTGGDGAETREAVAQE